MIRPTDGDPYENLANGIILQAVTDYRKALKKLKREPDDYPAKYMKREVERFFTSRWYTRLTEVDGKMLLDRLGKEAGYDEE